MIFAGMDVNEEVKNKPNCVVFGRDLMSEWAFHEKNLGWRLGLKRKSTTDTESLQEVCISYLFR